MSGTLQEKRAIITGAGGGIGSAIARAFARAGADVMLLDLPAVDLTPLQAEIEGFGRRAICVPLDLLDVADIAELGQRVELDFGGLDILCNAAGVQVRKPLAEVSVEEWDRVLNVNLRAAFLTCQVLARFLRRPGGAVVNIASITSTRAIENVGPYAASKAGLAQLTRELAIEWRGEGARVNAVAPGYVRTALTENVLKDPERSAWRRERIPLGHFAEPEDIADPVVFLASHAARYITGQVLYVDGGWTAW